MALYTKWQEVSLFVLCETLSDAERKRDNGLFFGSIHHTLDHILMVDGRLLRYVIDGRPPSEPFAPGRIVHEDYNALKQARLAFTDDLLTLIDGRPDGWLAAQGFYDGVPDAVNLVAPRAIIITTKQYRFAVELVRRAGIDIDASRVYGLEKLGNGGKRAVLGALLLPGVVVAPHILVAELEEAALGVALVLRAEGDPLAASAGLVEVGVVGALLLAELGFAAVLGEGGHGKGVSISCINGEAAWCSGWWFHPWLVFFCLDAKEAKDQGCETFPSGANRLWR